MSLTQFDVGINFRAIDNLTRPIAGFGRAIRDSFGGAEQATRGLSNSLNGINSTLGNITKGFSALGGEINRIGSNLTHQGILPYHAQLRAFQGLLHEGQRYETELAKFTAQTGWGDDKMAEAEKWARANKIIGVSNYDTLKLLQKSTSIFRDLHHAEDFVPTLSKMKFGIEAIMGEEHGTRAERMFMDALKVVELRGGFNDVETGAYDKQKGVDTLNLMQKAFAASGGMVNPTEYLNLIKTGGVAAKRLNDSSFFFGMMHMMQEMGGNRVGTALMSGYQNWVMGRTTQAVAEEMVDAGMIKKEHIKYGRDGQILKNEAGALNKVELFRADPFKYMEDEILPGLRKKGIKDGDEMQDALDKLFSNRTWGSLLNTLYRERELIKKHTAAGEDAAGINEMYQIALGTYQGQKIIFDSKWADFKLALGLDTGFLAVATEALKLFGNGLAFITNAAKEHPEVTKYAVGTLAAAAAAAAVFGGTRLLSKVGGLIFGKKDKGSTAGRIAENLLGGGIQKVFVVNQPGGLGDFDAWSRKNGRNLPDVDLPNGGRRPGIIRRTVSVVWRGISNLGMMLDRVTGGRLGRAARLVGGLFSRFRIPASLGRVGGVLTRMGSAAGIARTAFGLLWRVFTFTPLGRLIWLAGAVYYAFTHWDTIWPKIKAGFAGMVTAIKSRIRSMIDDVRKQPARIIEIFATLPFQLIKLGADAINGFIKGMFDVDIGAKAREIGNRIVGGVKSALNIQSPSRVMMALGGHTIDGLTLGIERGSGGAMMQMSKVARQLAGQRFAVNAPEFAASNVLPFRKLATAGMQAASNAPSSGSTYNITVNAAPGMDAAAIAREVQRQLDLRERQQERRKEARFADRM